MTYQYMKKHISRNAAAYFGGQIVWTGSQWLLVLFLARLSGPSSVGTLTFAFALSAPIIAVSQLALRQVLNIDITERFTMNSYRGLRLVATISAVTLIIVVGTVLGYRDEALLTIIFVAMARGLESLSDIEHGLMQRSGRLDRAAISFLIRAIVSLILGVIAFAATESVAAVALSLTVGAAASLFLVDRRGMTTTPTLHENFRAFSIGWRSWMLITRHSLPLTVVSLLISINANVPRYAVEYMLGSIELGYLAAITQLISIGGLSITSLGQALLPELVKAWSHGDLHRYKLLAFIYSAISAIIGLLAVCFTYAFGGEILGLLYGPSFKAAGGAFPWLMAAGAVYFVSSAVGLIAMATGRFASLMVPYALITSVTSVLSLLLLPRLGLQGIAVATATGHAIGVVTPILTIIRASCRK